MLSPYLQLLSYFPLILWNLCSCHIGGHGSPGAPGSFFSPGALLFPTVPGLAPTTKTSSTRGVLLLGAQFFDLEILKWKNWSNQNSSPQDVLLKSFLQKYFPQKVPGPQGRANRNLGNVSSYSVFKMKHKVMVLGDPARSSQPVMTHRLRTVANEPKTIGKNGYLHYDS